MGKECYDELGIHFAIFFLGCGRGWFIFFFSLLATVWPGITEGVGFSAYLTLLSHQFYASVLDWHALGFAPPSLALHN